MSRKDDPALDCRPPLAHWLEWLTGRAVPFVVFVLGCLMVLASATYPTLLEWRVRALERKAADADRK